VAAILDDVAARVALAEARGDERPADQRHADLAAVQVAGHGERDAVGHVRELVRVVAEEDHGGAVGNVAQRALDVGRAEARVLDARDPEVARAERVVLEDGDAVLAQCRAHTGAVVQPVVVAEHRDDAERRAQCGQALGHRPRRDARAEGHLGVDVVAEQEDEVRALGVDRGDDARDARGADVRRAGVQIGDERDAQAVEPGRPVCAEVERDIADAAAVRLVPEPAPRDGARREAGGGGGGGYPALQARGG
jgi:hypothetical protein